VDNVEVHASNNLLGELEKIIRKHGMPESAVSAKSLALKEAEENGKYYQIGEYLRFKKPDNEDIIIFVDKKPRGKINFKLYGFTGESYSAKIKINLDGKTKVLSTDYYRSHNNIVLWFVDQAIRREILNEGETNRFIGGC
jgi:hypothetical protein